MGVLLGYAIVFVCLFFPPLLIYHSGCVAGWRKVVWVSGSVLSALLPVILFAGWLAFERQYGGYEPTPKSMVFGPEANARALSNLGMLVMPWISYFIFRIRCANSQS
jgi:hypothetical protein